MLQQINYKTEKLGIVLYTWTNIYADAKIPFATCIDEDGKRYNIAMDDIRAIEDLDDEEFKELGLN